MSTDTDQPLHQPASSPQPPDAGQPQPMPLSGLSGGKKSFLATLVIATGIFMLWPDSESPSSSTPATVEEVRPSGLTESQERVAIDEAKERVRAHLRDPDSAKFGGAMIGPRGVVCGVVNAKNGFGGYTGMQPYFVNGEKVLLVGSEEETLAVHIAIAATCMNKHQDAAASSPAP